MGGFWGAGLVSFLRCGMMITIHTCSRRVLLSTCGISIKTTATELRSTSRFCQKQGIYMGPCARLFVGRNR